MIPHNRPTLGHEEAVAAQRVLASGWVAQGPEVTAFEDEICAFLGLPEGHAVAVSSGSAALYLALMASSAAGRTVAAPAYSCRSLWNAIELAGSRAVWLDVAPSRPNVAGATFRESCAELFIVAHMFGIPESVPDSGEFVIEDCAQALGARIGGRPVGCLGALGVLSFGATKLMTSGGQGGMVVSADSGLIEHLRRSRDYDTAPDVHPRFNFQMTDLQAAIGRVQLKRLPDFLRHRKQLFEIYRSHGLPLLQPGEESACAVHFRAVVRTTRPTELQAELAQAGVRAIVPVTPEELLAPESVVPHAAELARQTLSLPVYPTLTFEDAERIAKICARGVFR